MSFQMSEIEFAVIDCLADGAQTLTCLVHELYEGQHPWDRGIVANALMRLIEKQLIRSNRIPGGPPVTDLSPEAVHARIAAFPEQKTADCWVELTESGQAVWEIWRQASPGNR